MSKINTKTNKPKAETVGGAPAFVGSPEYQLRRSVCSCLLWEGEFYEDGVSIAKRIADTIPKVSGDKVSALAIEAREAFKLRHVPLLITREMARYSDHKRYLAQTLEKVIQRPDELAEFLAIYWKDGKSPISSQVKKGLASAFNKFDEYALAKYNRDGAIKLRDVLFLCHAKPKDKEQEAIWKKLIDGTLAIPDTWETSLSKGGQKKSDSDKRVEWTRLLKENKLGAMALMRNLRNMEQAGVNRDLIGEGLLNMNPSRVLPFRFISASKHAMHFEPQLEKAMLKMLETKPKLPGKTIIVIDISGSMVSPLSGKSEMSRMDAACSLGMLARELCEDARVYATAGNDHTRVQATCEVPARRGFALRDAIKSCQTVIGGGGIFLTPATKWIKDREKTCDRMIVITDEADCAGAGANAPSKAQPFGTYNYLMNVDSYKEGIGFDKWIKINGFSEAVFDYIRVSEGGNLN